MCHSKIEIERYFTGDLCEQDVVRVRGHIDECEDCRLALAELEADKIRFLNVYPFEDYVKSVSAPVRQSVFGRLAEMFNTPWRIQLFGGVAAVSALLLLMIPLMTFIKSQDEEDTVRYKGVSRHGAGAEMSFLYMRGGEMMPGSLDQLFREGDRLQFIYSHPREHHAALFSVDNSGLVSFYTRHEDGAVSVPSDSGSELTFPLSVDLDGSGGEELVVMLISETPVMAGDVEGWVTRLSKNDYHDLSVVEEALRQNKPDPLTTVSALRIKKE